MDQKHTYRFNVLLDNLGFNEINYSVAQQISFYYEKGKCKFIQAPVAAWIYKVELQDEHAGYGFYYKGFVPQRKGDEVIAKDYADGREPAGGFSYNIENRISLHTPDDGLNNKLNLLFQIPYFKKFYNLLKQQSGMTYGNFREYACEWDKRPLLETSLKEGGFTLASRCHGGGSTINKILLLQNETKEFARKVIKRYGNSKSFHAITFKDTLEIGREHIPNGDDEGLFKSGSNVKKLHQVALVINGKITKEMEAAAHKKLDVLRKQLSKKRFDSKLIEITQPSSKSDVRKAGQEMNNCIGNYNPKNIYLVYINLNNEKFMVGVEWKPLDKKPKQIHTYDNGNLPDNGEKQIIKNIKEVRNGSKEN